MALTSTLKKTSSPPGVDELILLLTASGNYTTGGDTINVSPQALLNPDAVEFVPFNNLPLLLDIIVEGGSGYYGIFIPGTTQANGKVQFFQANGTEVANGAYPAQLTGAKIFAYMELDRSVA